LSSFNLFKIINFWKRDPRIIVPKKP